MTTLARMRLVPAVDLLMAFKIVKSYEALLTMSAEPLSVTQVGLYMTFDVLFPSKILTAFGISACPFPTGLFRISDIGTDLRSLDASIDEGRV